MPPIRGPLACRALLPLPEPCPRAAVCQREAKGVRRGLGQRGRMLNTRLPGTEAICLMSRVSRLALAPSCGSGYRVRSLHWALHRWPCPGGQRRWLGPCLESAAPPLPPLSLAGCMLRGSGRLLPGWVCVGGRSHSTEHPETLREGRLTLGVRAVGPVGGAGRG